MNYHCCVPFCKSKKSRKMYVHEFPSDINKTVKWLQAIGRENYRPNLDREGVCTLHFLDSDYSPLLKRRRLKPYAVPSMFLFKMNPFQSAQKIFKLLKSSKLTEIKESRKLASSSPISKNYTESSSPHTSDKVNNDDCTKNLSLPETENLTDISETSTSNDVEIVYFKTNPSLSTSEDETKALSFQNGSFAKLSASENLSTSTYSKNALNAQKELCSLKLQNTALKAKIFRSEKRIAKLQSGLNAVTKQLNVYTKSKEYFALLNILKASAEKNISVTEVMNQFLLFSKQLTRK